MTTLNEWHKHAAHEQILDSNVNYNANYAIFDNWVGYVPIGIYTLRPQQQSTSGPNGARLKFQLWPPSDPAFQLVRPLV